MILKTNPTEKGPPIISRGLLVTNLNLVACYFIDLSYHDICFCKYVIDEFCSHENRNMPRIVLWDFKMFFLLNFSLFVTLK